MLYNVIIFIFIVIVLVFGGMFNILVRRFVVVDEGFEVGLVVFKKRIQECVGLLVEKFKKGKIGNVLDELGIKFDKFEIVDMV